MPTRMLPHLVLACVLAGATSLAVADDANPRRERGQRPAPEQADLEFPGGTVPEFIATIRQAFGDVNVVSTGDAEQFAVPPMRLHNVSLHDVVPLLQHVARFKWEDEDETLTGHLNTQHVGSTWVVQAWVGPRQPRARPGQPRPPAPPAPGIVTRVFSIADILQHFEADDVFTSIETALGLNNDEASAELRLHEETGLLIVRGQPDQASLVYDVVSELRVAAEVRARDIRYIRRDAAEQDMNHLREQVRQLEAEIERLRGRGIFEQPE